MKPILFNTYMVRSILDGRKTVTRRVVKARNTEILDKSKWSKGPYWFDVIKTKNGQKIATADKILPPYNPGDILYVRETWRCIEASCPPSNCTIEYKAGGTERFCGIIALPTEGGEWKPSIHMPKEAARIFLRVIRVSVERLQDISNADAIKEGITRMYDHLSDEEYEKWSRKVVPGKKKDEWGWDNYLWHGHFGAYGTGSALSDAWEYQHSGYDEPRGSFSSLWNKTVPLKDWGVYGWGANPWVWVIEFERTSEFK